MEFAKHIGDEAFNGYLQGELQRMGNMSFTWFTNPY